MPVRRASGARRTGPSSSTSHHLVLAGRWWSEGRLRAVEVGIDEDGWIRATGKSLRATGRRLDLGDAVLLPSATDIHAHFRDPGGPDAAESFETGTEGAALGGVGSAVDMPNTFPPVTDRERWEAKAARARGRLTIDVALFGSAASAASVRSLAPVAAGLKLYLSATTGAEEPPTEAKLAGILGAAAASRLPFSVHAEWPPDFVSDLDSVASTEAWNRARPPRAELDAVERVLRTPPSARLHIAHATLPATVDATRAAGVSCEATPHHLLLAASPRGTAFMKTNPPLRPESDRRGLWQRFTSGKVPLLASDHAPHTQEAKSGAFELAPSGVPGIETMVPMFLALVRAGSLPLPVLVSAAMDRPARWLGQPTGRIAPAHRANLIAVDFRRHRAIVGARLRSPAGWSPFEGRPAIFPTWHFRDGVPIVQDGELLAVRTGHAVRPEFAP